MNTRPISPLAALALACLLPIGSHAADKPLYGNRLIVKFKTTAPSGKVQVMNADKMQALSNSAGARLDFKRSTGGGARVFSLPAAPPAADMDAIIARLQARDDVEYAEVDYKRYPAAFPVDAPDDPFFTLGAQWYLQDNSAVGNRGASAVQAVWEQGLTGQGVTVAVVDTGLTPHVDLGDNIIPGYDFIDLDPDDSSSTDGDSMPGRDSNPSDPGDLVTASDKANIPTFRDDTACQPSVDAQSSWHGTLVSGVLAARTDNGIGIAGIAPHARVVVSRALGKCGGYNSDIMDAARWSAGLAVPGVPANPHPAKVVNLSLGGGTTCSRTEQKAIKAINSAGAIVVVAAGNDADDAAESAPGNCDKAFNVAATTRFGGETVYTNVGEEIDISAPGGSNADSANPLFQAPIVTTTQNPPSGTGPILTDNNSGYANVEGTSFAAPVVSGIIALMLERKPDLDPSQIRSLLTSNATPFPVGTSDDAFRDCTTARCGAGIANAKQVIEAIDQGRIPPPDTSKSGGGHISYYYSLVLGLLALRRRKRTC